MIILSIISGLKDYPMKLKMNEDKNVLNFDSEAAKEIADKKLGFEFKEGWNEFEVIGNTFEKRNSTSKKNNAYVIYDVKIKVNDKEEVVSLWEAQIRIIIKGIISGNRKFIAHKKGDKTEIAVKN
jgi:hypothetical protein